jgi:hypothetical protein
MSQLVGTLEAETREFAVQSGGRDILAGGCLFCVVAIRQNRIARERALVLTRWAPDPFDGGFVYPGARCPSYAGPMRIAHSFAASAERNIKLDDIWVGLQQYDSGQFTKLCSTYGITDAS